MISPVVPGGILHIELPMAKSWCYRLTALASDKGNYTININVDGP